ncbi:MAG: hypothetical protein ABIQ43_01990 [Sphingomonas sp.]
MRTNGSHRQYVRPGVAEVLTVLPRARMPSAIKSGNCLLSSRNTI